jgi:hypothetical protein
MYNFTYNRLNTLTVNIPSFIAVMSLFFIKSQFTTNTQSILHLNQCTPRHVLSRNVSLYEMSRGACEWFDRRQESFSEMSLLFELQLNVLEFFLSVPTDKIPKDWCRMNVAAVARKICADIYGCKYFSSVLCGENQMDRVIFFESNILLFCVS